MREHNPSPGHRTRRRKQTVAGVAGLAVLGVGAFLVTTQLADNDRTETRDALAPLTPVSSPETSVSPVPSPSHSAPESPDPTTAPTTAPTTRAAPDPEVSREISAARSAAAADGVPLQRALTAKAEDSVPDVRVVTSGTPQEPGGTLKVVTARGDLTGYEELAWVADKGDAVGTARCTQSFRLSNDAKATERPTLLICWRTSEAKSVYTVAVDLAAAPSRTTSVAAIDKAWAKLT